MTTWAIAICHLYTYLIQNLNEKPRYFHSMVIVFDIRLVKWIQEDKYEENLYLCKHNFIY